MVDQLTRAYFQVRAELEGVTSAELVRRVKAGEVIALDVRPEEEYRASRIPGALSIPVDELKARFKELPKGRQIVAYCRGPYCVMVVEPSSFCARRASGRSAWRWASKPVARLSGAHPFWRTDSTA